MTPLEIVGVIALGTVGLGGLGLCALYFLCLSMGYRG